MIASKDRSGYIGASDTRFVMGKWTSKTFENWWREKQGITCNNFTNEAMQAGTRYLIPLAYLDLRRISRLLKVACE